MTETITEKVTHQRLSRTEYAEPIEVVDPERTRGDAL